MAHSGLPTAILLTGFYLTNRSEVRSKTGRKSEFGERSAKDELNQQIRSEPGGRQEEDELLHPFSRRILLKENKAESRKKQKEPKQKK